MKAKLLGIISKSGTSKKTGNDYDAYFLQLCYPSPGCVGLKVEECYVDKSFMSEIVTDVGELKNLVGRELILDTDLKGFLQAVSITPELVKK